MSTASRGHDPTGRGRRAEEAARRFLESRGLQTLARNYRCRRGEIDLIMRHGDEVVFVEVRRRTSETFGSGAETVDGRKRRRLAATAEHFLQSRALTDRCACRFDVVSIRGPEPRAEIDWIQDAFDASD